MSSNSKLNSHQKALRKEWIESLPEGATLSTRWRMTVVCVPEGNITWAFSSLASQDEVKIRPKVGQFYALSRWVEGGHGFMLPGHWDADELLEVLDNYCGL